jgi:hypothetical protein
VKTHALPSRSYTQQIRQEVINEENKRKIHNIATTATTRALGEP